MRRILCSLILLQNIFFAIYGEVAFVNTDARCRIFSETVILSNCTKAFLGRRSVLNVQIASGRDLYDLNFKMNIHASITNNRKVEYRNLRLNLCDFLKPASRANFFGLVIKRLQLSADNFPNGCPFLKNVRYGIRNFYLEPANMLGFAARGRIKVVIDLFEGTTRLLRYTVKALSCDVNCTLPVENITNFCVEANAVSS